jgi:hypothetical protein
MMAVKQTRSGANLEKRLFVYGLLFLGIGVVLFYGGMYWAFSTLGEPMPDWLYNVQVILSWGSVTIMVLGLILLITAGCSGLNKMNRR